MTKQISFYSFKGGTGRSTSLCNVAYALADSGAKVGCIDFDIEAAGLNYIFNIPDGPLDDCQKVQEYLFPNDGGYTDPIEEYIIDVADVNRYDIDGELYMIPAGTDPELQTKQGNVNIQKKMDTVRDLYDSFQKRKNLDYLLVDTRSGQSQMAMPSIVNADETLIFFRWSRQHRMGTIALTEWVQSRISYHGGEIYMVASNIPGEVDNEDIETYVNDRLTDVRGFNIIPESKYLRTNERILTCEFPDSEGAAKYRELAGEI